MRQTQTPLGLTTQSLNDIWRRGRAPAFELAAKHFRTPQTLRLARNDRTVGPVRKRLIAVRPKHGEPAAISGIAQCHEDRPGLLRSSLQRFGAQHRSRSVAGHDTSTTILPKPSRWN